MAHVEYSIDRTVQTAPYESLKIHVGVVDDIHEGESTKEAFKRVFAEVEAAYGSRIKIIAGDKN